MLFALSTNFPRSEDLQQVVNALINFNDTEVVGGVDDALSTKGKSKGHTLGCLAGSFASTSFEAGHKQRRTQPQVGRWHSFRKKEEVEMDNSTGGSGRGLSESEGVDVSWPQRKDGGVNWEEVWNRLVSEHSLPLPDGLRQTNPSQIETLLTFSSPYPDKLTHTISKYLFSSISNTHPSTYPHYACLIAAPTHFVTGREVTLILDGEIYGEGAVGVAFLRREQATEVTEPRSRVEFLGVKRLSKPMSVTSREGNMINGLDQSNPTRLLLDSLSESGICSSTSQYSLQSPASFFKDGEQFALGVLDANGQISRTYKITAGDPSSRGGSLSLDAQRAPEVGSIVLFLHRSSNAPVEIPESLFPSAGQLTSKHVLGFLAVPEPLSGVSALETSPRDMASRVLENTFLVPSTGGFTVSEKTGDNHSDPTWSCSMPGGIAMVEWY
ncbi:hypothetical protein M413DRAFT_27082 [Hebeloma cylindrosporum]|uniref:FIST domain-containing protein n=1 Tax=Hebeloma cylindrosporum TaxID=76867 RepID=A0A0C3C089_HEBCY|nr:hypothetical protein M413DRAFT_27082 [Hebeloma cylindrosporum h7]